jgi:hypothetical protein
MGLGANVMCRCFVEGKTQPPFSVPIKVAEDGSLYLDLPLEGNEETHLLFSNWRESGCAHRGMVYESEGINWRAYRSFQQALAEAGWEQFPTLEAELPQTNDGVTSSNAAAQMLAELAFFSEQAELGQVTILVDSDTGEELHHYIAPYGGEFHYGPSGDIFGVDEAGFFIRRSVEQGSQEVFRAMRVKQLISDPNEAAEGSQPWVTFENLDSGVRYACAEPLVKIVYWPNGVLQNAEGQVRLGYPNRVHVLTRKRVAADFEAVVNSLRTICEAAVQIGNPIAWR